MDHFIFNLPDQTHRKGASVLTAFFFLGHFLGVWLSGLSGDSLFSAMRAVVSSRVSIIGLLSSLALPLLFSAFAVWLARPMLLIPIAFWKAFLFSYLGSGLVTAWGSAGWLIALLVLGGDLCSLPLLYWYWLRHIGGRRFELPPAALLLGLLSAIGIAQFCLIEPFLAEIISF